MSQPENYEEFWKEYDTGETDKLHLTKSGLCHKMLNVIGDDSKKTAIESELNLHNFYFWIHSSVENIQGFKLESIQQYVSEFQHRCCSDYAYFDKRLQETASILNKSKYALGCWYLANDSKYLIIAVDSILQSADDPHKEDIDQVYYLITAFNLVKIYNLNQFHTRINNLALKFFYNFMHTKPRWMIEPVNIFVELNSSADNNLINNMISNLHKHANNFFLDENYPLHQSLLKTSIPLVKFTNLDNSMKGYLKKEILTMIAESNEDDANKRWNKDESTASVHFFEIAKEYYEKAGKHDKIDDLNQKIREATQDIKWAETKTEFTMPSLNLKGNTGMELINSLCNYREQIPNLDKITQEVKKQMDENPISTIFSKTTFNKKNPVFHDSEDSLLQSEIRCLTILNIQTAENHLSLAVKALEDENKITPRDFLKFFEDMKVYDSDRFAILKSAIHNHFNGDFIASVHMLIPQIEGVIRSVLEKKGVYSLKTKKDKIIMDNELGGILNKNEVEKIFGSDLIHYLKIKYTEPSGLNQRNEISHALTPVSEFKHSTSLSIIHDLMILTTFA